MKAQKELNNNEISSFCGQMAMILNAGITPAAGLSILLSDSKDGDGRKILKQIHDSCEHGQSFYHALESTHVFPDYVLNMVHLGEESGNLDNIMQSLSQYYDRQESLNENIRNAVSYPFIMIVMMLAVVIVLITKILPIFEQVFEQLGTEMTGFARSLLHLGNAISHYAVVFTVILVVAVVLYFFFSLSSSGKKIWRHFLMSFPPTRRFYNDIAAGRFAGGISLAVSSGLDTSNALDMVSDLVDNPGMQSKISKCKSAIHNGDDFAKAISETGIFTNLYSSMINVAMKSGLIDVVMSKIADDYENDIDRRIRNGIAILEPTLVIILSVIVGLILLSVILPLMGIMTSIG